MSHVHALERIKGKEAILKLVARSGKRARYRDSEDVPVRDEVIIIEHILDMVWGKKIAPTKRSFEGGKLHFKNFSETPLGGLVLRMFRFKTGLMKAGWIARRVFRGVEFRSEDLGPKKVCVTMGNNDYPIEHFQGFFHAWMKHSRHKGKVDAEDLGEDAYAYTIRWK